MKFKVLINWKGEVLKFYTVAKDEDVALRNVLRQCARRLCIEPKAVRDHVLDSAHRRWEVIKVSGLPCKK